MNTNFESMPKVRRSVTLSEETMAWITAYIQLPEGYNPEDIDATTILLNGTISPVLDPKYDFVTNSS
jgi:hypothetical protein